MSEPKTHKIIDYRDELNNYQPNLTLYHSQSNTHDKCKQEPSEAPSYPHRPVTVPKSFQLSSSDSQAQFRNTAVEKILYEQEAYFKEIEEHQFKANPLPSFYSKLNSKSKLKKEYTQESEQNLNKYKFKARNIPKNTYTKCFADVIEQCQSGKGEKVYQSESYSNIKTTIIPSPGKEIERQRLMIKGREQSNVSAPRLTKSFVDKLEYYNKCKELDLNKYDPNWRPIDRYESAKENKQTFKKCKEKFSETQVRNTYSNEIYTEYVRQNYAGKFEEFETLYIRKKYLENIHRLRYNEMYAVRSKKELQFRDDVQKFFRKAGEKTNDDEIYKYEHYYSYQADPDEKKWRPLAQMTDQKENHTKGDLTPSIYLTKKLNNYVNTNDILVNRLNDLKGVDYPEAEAHFKVEELSLINLEDRNRGLKEITDYKSLIDKKQHIMNSLRNSKNRTIEDCVRIDKLNEDIKYLNSMVRDLI